MTKGRPDLSSLQGETSQPHVITQASQSPGQPTVPKRWVAQGCEALAPGIFLFVTLTHHVAAEFRVLPAPKSLGHQGKCSVTGSGWIGAWETQAQIPPDLVTPGE